MNELEKIDAQELGRCLALAIDDMRSSAHMFLLTNALETYGGIDTALSDSEELLAMCRRVGGREEDGNDDGTT